MKVTVKRFIFSMREDVRQEIKLLAAKKNISMSLWITRAIYEQLKKER